MTEWEQESIVIFLGFPFIDNLNCYHDETKSNKKIRSR